MEDLEYSEYSEKTDRILETLLKDIDNIKYDVRSNPILEQSAEKVLKKHEASYRLGKIKDIIADNMVNKMGKEKFYEIISKVCPSEKVAECQKEILETAKRRFLKDKKIENEDELSLEQKELKYLETIEKKDHEAYQNLKYNKYYELFGKSLVEDKKVLFSIMDEITYNGYNTDEFLEDVLLPTDKGFIADSHPLEVEINAMISELSPNLDKDLIDALTYANEVIIKGDSTAKDYTSSLAEDYAEITSRVRSYTARINIENRLSDSSFLDKSEPFITLKNDREGNTNTAKFSNALKEVAKSDLKATYDEKVAAELLDIVKECEDAGIFNSKSLSFGESGSKVYSFYSLVVKRNELEKAVNEKDFAKIKTLSDEYKALDNAYMHVIDRLKALGVPGEIPGNISSSREGNIPQKYRNDFVGASRLTNLWNIYGMVKRFGLEMKDAVSDPSKSLRLMYEKSIHGDTETDHFLQTASNLDVMRGLLFEKNLFTDAKVVDGVIDNICIRGLSNLSFYLPAGQEKDEYSTMMDFTTQIIVNNSSFRIREQSLSYNPDELLSNILIVEPKDRNLYDMSGYYDRTIDINTYDLNKPYPSIEYLKSGKTSVDNILNRCGDLLSIFAENQNKRNMTQSLSQACNRIVKSFDTLVKKIDESQIECTKEQRVMLEQLRTVSHIKPLDNKILAAKLQALNYTTYKEKTTTTCELGLYNLAKLRAEWKSRGLLKKMFGPETRRLSREIEAIKRTYNGMGFSKEVIDQETAKYNSANPPTLDFRKKEAEYRKLRGEKKSPYTPKQPNKEKDLAAFAKAEALVPNTENMNIIAEKEEANVNNKVVRVEIDLDNEINPVKENNVKDEVEKEPVVLDVTKQLLNEIDDESIKQGVEKFDKELNAPVEESDLEKID